MRPSDHDESLMRPAKEGNHRVDGLTRGSVKFCLFPDVGPDFPLEFHLLQMLRVHMRNCFFITS
jgi:hypothetical protein